MELIYCKRRKLIYAMHENSVIRIVGYVMRQFSNGAKPIKPWSLHLNFNKTNSSFELTPNHFSHDGENITSELTETIKKIDSGFQVKGSEPVFEEVATKKKLKIRGSLDLGEILRNAEKPEEITFFQVMDLVFSKGDATL